MTNMQSTQSTQSVQDRQSKNIKHVKHGKRTNGEGSIYKDAASGLWVASMLVQGKRLVKRSKRQDTVRKWLVEMRAKAEQGLIIPTDRAMTVAELLDKWLLAIAPSLRPRTVQSYECIMRIHLKPGLGKYKLAGLRPDHVQAFYSAKLAQGCSRRVVQLCHAVLHHALKSALKWGLVARNVTEATTPPRPSQQYKVQVWDAADARRFLAALRDTHDRFESIYTLALAVGLRRGELLGLHREDVDLERGKPQVRRQLQQIAGQGLVEGEPKTERGRRQITLPPPALNALKAWRIRQKEERLRARRTKDGDEWHESPYVFTNTVGGPQDPRKVSGRFPAVIAHAGLPKIRFHDLRHTCASLLLQSGVHPKVVQEILGHSNISMTMDIYSHVLPSMHDGATSTMGQLLTGT